MNNFNSIEAKIKSLQNEINSLQLSLCNEKIKILKDELESKAMTNPIAAMYLIGMK